jgi:hypothetical protein
VSIRIELLRKRRKPLYVAEHDRNFHQLATKDGLAFLTIESSNEIHRRVLAQETHRGHLGSAFLLGDVVGHPPEPG